MLETACLLGAPLLLEEELATSLKFRCSELALAISKLENIAEHDALVLLRKVFVLSEAIVQPKMLPLQWTYSAQQI